MTLFYYLLMSYTMVYHKSMENPLKLHFYFPTITILAIVFCLSLSHGFSISEAGNKVHSFKIDLFHRDSPKSPLYDHTLTHSQRLKNSLTRSFHRAHQFHHHLHHNRSPSTAVIPDNGEYLMRILLGTPPTDIWAIADTGSDLIWTQCKPCMQCYKQKDELFDPSKSSTYRKISCKRTCLPLDSAYCEPTTKTCSYSVAYGDRSFSKGDIAMETLRLSPELAFPNITIGCGHESGGTFGSSSSGIIGLGGGKSSLISQLGSKIGGKFSYCLGDFTKNFTSTMNFGMSAIVQGNGVVTTSIADREPSTYLFLTLEGVSVGNKTFDFYSNQEIKNSKKGEEGNMIIDSGTTLTLLPSKLYQEIISEIQRYIKKETVPDPEQVLDLCYSSLSEQEVPSISMHFNGAEVKLNYINAFVEIGANISCFAFAPSRSLSIYGNIAQMNFLVGYDLEKRTVSFNHVHCGA